MLLRANNDYMCTVAPVLQSAVDVQSCQIGNLSSYFRIYKSLINGFYNYFNFSLDFLDAP